MYEIIAKLASGEQLDKKHRNHKLKNNKIQNCEECHIEPDWLLIYKRIDDKLILLLFATGSHTELFDK